MRFARILSLKVYLLIFLILFNSLKDVYENKIEAGFKRFTKFAVLPFLLYSGIINILLSEKKFSSHPYYELQVGAASLALFIGLLLALILNVGLSTLSIILLIFNLSIISKSIVIFKYSTINDGLRLIPFILIISYFVYLGFKTNST